MRDISNFGNNLRDEIIEYRLEHETGHTLEIKFVDHGDKTNAQIYLYSKTGEFLSKTEEFPFDQTGQRAVDRVELIRGSSEGHEAEYEIKVLFRGGKDPVYCPVDDILTTLRKELSNKITIDLDNSGEDESSVITSKIYNTSGEELSEDSFSLDDVKMTAQNISMIADAESEEAEPTSVFVADVKDKKVAVYDLDVDNSININKAKIDALEVTGDVKLGTHENSAAQPELAINTTAEFPGVSIEHTLSVKSTASFGNDVNVSGNMAVESGTVSSPIIKAANAFSVGKNNEEYLKVDATGIIASGNINASGNMNLIAGDKEVSLTENDFTINSMGESDASVTNKKYVNDLVNTERERAIEEESNISRNLTTETNRATAAESTLTTNLANEVTRATEKENELRTAISDEITRAEGAESTLSNNIQAEFNRADAAERANAKAIDTEKSRAETAETDLSERLAIIEGEDEGSIKSAVKAESTRAKAEESTIASKLDTEISRATGAESTLNASLEAEAKRATEKENELAKTIETESNRAKAAETALVNRLDIIEGDGEGSIKSAVNAENARATETELTLTNNLTAEVSAREQCDTELENSIVTTNSNLEKAKEDLNKLITAEKNRAIAKENELSTSISSEIEDRKSAITSAITKEASDRDAAISNSIGQEATARNTAITQEHDRAVEVEGKLQGKITSEITRATGVEEAIKADLATYAKSLELAGGKDTDYVYTFTLKDSSGKKLSEKSIDLPIESVVVSGRYDADTKNVILTLDSGGEISFSISDLIDGLVSDATFNNHVNNTNNPHGVTAAQVGLGNVTNVRTESVIEENSKNNVTSGAVYSHTSNKNNPHDVTKAQVGLENVDNTSDINKPISNATQTALDKKVDREAGKSLILDTEITRLADMSDGANKVEASTTNGKILIDGNEVSVYVEAEYVVHDKDYHHVSVSASEGVTSNNVTYKYDDTALSNSIEAAKTDISELKTRLNSLDDVIISKLVRLVSNLNDNQIDALVAFAQSLKVENVE